MKNQPKINRPHLLKAVLFFCIFILTQGVYALDQYEKGKGNSKVEAIAEALARIPYGATLKKVEINGSSIKTKEGEKGSYRCRVIWER